MIETIHVGAVANVPLGRGLPGIVAEDLHRAKIRTKMPGCQAHKCTLACPVGADQSGNTGTQLQSNLVDPDDRPVPLRDMLEEQKRWPARRRGASRGSHERLVEPGRL